MTQLAFSNLKFSVRTWNCLQRAGINTVEKLLNTKYEDLIRVRNLGQRCIVEIIQRLEENGYDCVPLRSDCQKKNTIEACFDGE